MGGEFYGVIQQAWHSLIPLGGTVINANLEDN